MINGALGWPMPQRGTMHFAPPSDSWQARLMGTVSVTSWDVRVARFAMLLVARRGWEMTGCSAWTIRTTPAARETNRRLHQDRSRLQEIRAKGWGSQVKCAASLHLCVVIEVRHLLRRARPISVATPHGSGSGPRARNRRRARTLSWWCGLLSCSGIRASVLLRDVTDAAGGRI